MEIYHKYEIVCIYIYRRHIKELSDICDICKMPIALLINFSFIFSFFFFLLFSFFEDLFEEKIATKVPDAVKQVKNELQITKLEGQKKNVLIELQDIRKRTIRDNLIFKGVDESANEKWENTTQVLVDFIHGNLNLGYSFNENLQSN